jgi:hypothetical protein
MELRRRSCTAARGEVEGGVALAPLAGEQLRDERCEKCSEVTIERKFTWFEK